MKPLPIARVILYVKDIPKVAAFYEKHFGLRTLPGATEGFLQLAGVGTCTVTLHQAAVSQKSGAAMKLSFGVLDVRGFREAGLRAGLKWGPVHVYGEIEFCNAKDPAGNSIQISNRGMIGEQ